MYRLVTGIVGVLLGTAMAFGQGETLAVGTKIDVRTNESIDMRDASDGRIFTGVVAQDVTDQNGRVAIPRGARAELIVRNLGREERAMDLESVDINGRRYTVRAEARSVGQRKGLGENKRTGEFVGGGALLGTIIGAIAGGGKGAAIGAGAGAAAGAGTQVITRGKSVFVPAEAVVSFRLNAPLWLANGPDSGYNRDGRHYHNDYNRYDNGDRYGNDSDRYRNDNPARNRNDNPDRYRNDNPDRLRR